MLGFFRGQEIALNLVTKQKKVGWKSASYKGEGKTENRAKRNSIPKAKGGYHSRQDEVFDKQCAVSYTGWREGAARGKGF